MLLFAFILPVLSAPSCPLGHRNSHLYFSNILAWNSRIDEIVATIETKLGFLRWDQRETLDFNKYQYKTH